MPIYEYECSKCHHQLDIMQKMNDAPALVCPQCLEESLVRLVSAAGFQLKGQGWYATDFKTKSVSSEKSDSVSKSKAVSSKATDKKSTPQPTETAASAHKKTQEGQ